MNCTDPISSVLRSKGTTVFSVEPSTSVFDALALMANHEIGALLVMEGGRLTGIISERDYARKVILQGRSSKDTCVADIMSSDLITVSCYDSVDHCMKLMTNHRIRHVPVVDGERIAGVISVGDLVKWVIGAQEQEIQHLQAYIAGGYPA